MTARHWRCGAVIRFLTQIHQHGHSVPEFTCVQVIHSGSWPPTQCNEALPSPLVLICEFWDIYCEHVTKKSTVKMRLNCNFWSTLQELMRYTLEDLQNLWEVAASHSAQRQAWIDALDKKLSELEKARMVQVGFGTMRPGQDGWHFAGNIFKCLFLNENFCLLIFNLLPLGSIDNMSYVVQVLAWRWTGSKPLSELMMTKFSCNILR